MKKDYHMPKALKKQNATKRNQLEKCPTGIKGLDEVTEGASEK
jgi:hypothetical protein